MRVVKGGSRFTLESAGFLKGNYAGIKINDGYIMSREQTTRGINVVAFNGTDH